MKTEIIFECADYIVVYKPMGYLSEDKENEKSCPAEIKEYLLSCGKNNDVYTVHRLDRTTDGLMVYALTKSGAAELSKIISDGKLKKTYRALISADPELPEQGEMRDYLYFDRKRDKSFVVDGERKGSKLAVLNYHLGDTLTIKEREVREAVVCLETGRTHQIRVQFAARKSPLIGDGKYGSRLNYKGASLTSIALEFEWKGKNVSYTLDKNKTPECII